MKKARTENVFLKCNNEEMQNTKREIKMSASTIRIITTYGIRCKFTTDVSVLLSK